MKISYEQVIRDIADSTSVSQKDVRAIVAALADTIESHLSDQAEVYIPKIGRFAPVHRNARLSKHPSTGEPVHIPAGFKLKFITQR